MKLDKEIEIPATFKKTSTYIKTIDRYQPVFQGKIIQALISTKKFWEEATINKSLIPDSIKKEIDDIDDLLKKYKQQNLECIKVVESVVGIQAFQEFIDPNSKRNIRAKKSQKKYIKKLEKEWSKDKSDSSFGTGKILTWHSVLNSIYFFFGYALMLSQSLRERSFPEAIEISNSIYNSNFYEDYGYISFRFSDFLSDVGFLILLAPFFIAGAFSYYLPTISRKFLLWGSSDFPDTLNAITIVLGGFIHFGLIILAFSLHYVDYDPGKVFTKEENIKLIKLMEDSCYGKFPDAQIYHVQMGSLEEIGNACGATKNQSDQCTKNNIDENNIFYHKNGRYSSSKYVMDGNKGFEFACLKNQEIVNEINKDFEEEDIYENYDCSTTGNWKTTTNIFGRKDKYLASTDTSCSGEVRSIIQEDLIRGTWKSKMEE